MSELQTRLGEAGFRITTSLAGQVRAALNTRPCAGCFLTGPAGAGKTFLAESLASIENRRTFFFQAFPGCRKEELYQTILPDAAQPSGFRTQPGVLPMAAQASVSGLTALVLDEWDKTHPSTDAFLLDFLQNGRVSLPGSELQADLNNLVVFITLNDEREMSEPLLRRLPLIELQPPPPGLVAQALADTHGQHAYIGAAVTLYRRSQLVNLTKPVTIQELRQLLDAIDLLAHEADWNRLVFQFVTKNWDDHELLKSAEDLPLPASEDNAHAGRAALDVQHYSTSDYLAVSDRGAIPELPRVQRSWLERMPSRDVSATPEQVFGVVPRTESGYDGVARALLSRAGTGGGAYDGTHGAGEDPADLRVAQVGAGEIIVFEALNFERLEEWALVLQHGGELLLEARHGGEITTEMLLEFKTRESHSTLQNPSPSEAERCRIYSLTAGEVLLRYRGLKLRWTPELLEVVTGRYEETREVWDFLYGPRGMITAGRAVEQRLQEPGAVGRSPGGAPTNEQLRDDYLFVLRDYRHLREWFALLINRNLRVWGRVTCEFRNLTVVGSILPNADFLPEKESPESKEEADSITTFRALTQPAIDYYESHLTHVESELQQFVAKNGECPPAVEDGGIFGLHEVHADLDKLKRAGLKHYMRKLVREA